MIKISHTLTNETNRYLVVGDCHEVISQHSTYDDALEVVNKTNIEASKWADVRVVKPGETVSGNYIQTISRDNEESSPFDDFLRQFRG